MGRHERVRSKRTHRGAVAAALVFSLAAGGHSLAQPESEEVQPSATDGSGDELTEVKLGPNKEVRPLEPPIQMRQILPEDGLPQSQVMAIAQDPRGFLWFGTQEGVARFDGAEFVVYRHQENDPHSLPGSFVNALAVDGKGQLWLGAAEHGLARYDDKADRFIRYLSETKDEIYVGQLAVDTNGQLYVGTNAHGLHRYDQGQDDFERIRGADSITALARHRDGGVWVAAPDGILRHQPGKDTLEPLLVDDMEAEGGFTALAHDGQGKLWVGTRGAGLFVVDPGAAKVVRRHRAGAGADQLSNDIIYSIYEDRGGNVWVGTDKGINKFSPQGEMTRFMKGVDASNESFPHTVLSMLEDLSGQLWIGTIAGIRIYDPLRLRFHHFKHNDFLTGITANDDGSDIWAITYANGLYRYDRKAGQTTIYRALRRRGGGEIELTQYWLTTVFLDKEGILWLAGEGTGLIRFDPKSELADVYRLVRGDLEAYRLNWIIQSRSGDLWIATWDAGLVRFDPRSKSYDMYVSSDGELGVPSDNLYTLREDRKVDGMFWIGSANGLIQFRADSGTVPGGFVGHDPSDPRSLSHNYAVTIYQEESGRLWVGTYGGGLNMKEPGSDGFVHFTTEDGLPNNSVYGILPGPDNTLWMSTNGGGLARFDPAKKTFHSYGFVDGVQGAEFIQNSYHRTESGLLMFGGTNGFNVFDPSELGKDEAPPPVVLTGIKIKNKPAALGKTPWHTERLHLGYTDSVVTFEFAALTYGDGQDAVYKYKLEGLHDDWIETRARSVTYSSLDGGDYTFRVKAANRFGVWNERGVAVKLEVDPPPWKTWWAYAIYATILILIGLAIWRYQRRRLAALQQANRLASVERDLEITGAIQAGFLPQENPISRPTLDLIGLYRPAGSAGGDWWWYEETEASNAQHILVGDVTGHGPGPAIVTAAVATAFRVQESEADMSEKLVKVNREVLAASQGKYHVVLSALEIDRRTGDFTFRSAGGLPMVVVKPDVQRPKVVHARGTPLGAKDFTVGSATGTLAPGDRLYLFTDGIVEQNMSNGKQIGMRRLMTLFKRASEMPLGDAASAFMTEMDLLRQHEEQEDDWTLAMFEWRQAVAGDYEPAPTSAETNIGGEATNVRPRQEDTSV